MSATRSACLLAATLVGCATPDADVPLVSQRSSAAVAATGPHVSGPKGFRMLGGREFSHAADINAMAVSPDGRHLATSTVAGELAVWDVASKALLSKVPALGALAGQSMAFSAAGDRLAINVKGFKTVVLEVLSGKVLFTIPSSNTPPTFFESQLWLTEKNELFAIDLASGRRTTTLSFDKSPVKSVAVSTDGKWIGAASFEEVKVWPRAGGAAVLSRKEKHPGALTFTEDSKELALANSEKILVLQVATGQLDREIFTSHHGLQRLLVRDQQLFSLRVEYDNTAIIARHAFDKKQAYGAEAEQRGGAVALASSGPAFIANGSGLAGLDPATLTRSHVAGHTDRVAAVAISEDGRRLLSAAKDGLVLAWDLAGNNQQPTLLGDSGDRSANVVTVSPSGRYAAFATSIDRSKGVRVVELSSGQTLFSSTTYARPTGVRFVDHESTLWLGTERGEAESWSITQRARERALPLVAGAGLDEGYADVLFFNDRAVVVRERAGAGSDAPGPASSFSLPGGRPLAKQLEDTVHGDCRMGEQLLYCPTGAKQVAVMDATSGKLVRRIDVGRAIDAVAEGDDGKTLVVAEHDGAWGTPNVTPSIALYSLADGRLLSRTVAPKLLTAVACSGQTIAFGAADGSVGTFGR